MSIQKQIKNNLTKVRNMNEKKKESYKKRLEQQILTNLKEGKKPEDQKVLYSKYCSAKPRELTQMQQAMQDALV